MSRIGPTIAQLADEFATTPAVVHAAVDAMIDASGEGSDEIVHHTADDPDDHDTLRLYAAAAEVVRAQLADWIGGRELDQLLADACELAAEAREYAELAAGSREARDAAIVAARNAGASYARLADATGLSYGMLSRIITAPDH